MDSLQKVDAVFSDIILTSNYCRNNNLATWSDYSPGIFNQILYVKEYEDLINNRQYSFLLKDKSFLQFYYQFDSSGELIKAKLCYYPYPVGSKENSQEIEEYFQESDTSILESYYLGIHALQEVGIVTSNNSHFRFDFDSNVTSHSTSHAQFGGLNNLRIPFKKIINPFLFFDFILKGAYGDYDKIKDKIESSSLYKQSSKRAKLLVIDSDVDEDIHLNFVQ